MNTHPDFRALTSDAIRAWLGRHYDALAVGVNVGTLDRIKAHRFEIELTARERRIMPGMAPYAPTPKADRFKPGDTVQWREESLMGHGYRLGQLWSRAENPTRTARNDYGWRTQVAYQGKFWFVVTEDRTAYRVSERDLTHVMSREEQRVLI